MLKPGEVILAFPQTQKSYWISVLERLVHVGVYLNIKEPQYLHQEKRSSLLIRDLKI